MTTEDKKDIKITDRLWTRIAIVSGVFALLIGVLLIANYVQTKKADPVNITVINSLVERLYENPADSLLRQEIRAIDLLARKAYFTSQWQIRIGGYFMLAAIALIIIAFQVLEYRKKINPVINTESEDEMMLQRAKARKWIVAGSSVFLMIAIVFAVLASNDLADRFNELGGDAVTNDPSVANSQGEETTFVPSEDINNSVAEISSEVAVTETETEKTTASDLAASPSTDNFPNFRGIGGTGIASKSNIPVSWDGTAGTNIIWKTKIPLPGYNSPIVWGDKVFVTGADGKKQEMYCIDRLNGEILWTTPVGSGNKNPQVIEETGFSAATAVTDGVGVYSIFPTGEIVGVDMNGNILWERDLGLPDNHYGHSSSLMIFNGNILVQFDQKTAPRLMALSTKTGKTVWSTDRPVKISWSSPILINTGTRNEVILAAEPYVASYNPANGQELWKIDCIAGEVGPSLAYANGIVFSVNEYSKLTAIKIGAQPTILWENNDYLSEIPSPVANDKYLFLPTSYGVVLCYDAITGEKYWEEEMGSSGIFSSPMIVEGKVYLQDRSGVMHIFSADKEFKLIGEANLGEDSATTPAFTQGRIYIRGEENLYCIGE